MAVAITNSPIVAFNTAAVVTSNAATADTDALAEVFTYTATASEGKTAIIIGSGKDGATGATFAYSIAAGDLWAGQAITGTVAHNTEAVIQVENARVMQDDGKILITLTPGASDRLLLDLAAYVKVVELL